jgi:hypothetical protein
MGNEAARQAMLDEIARDVDLLVYRLEQPPPDRDDERVVERRRLRRDLERLRERIEDLARED